MTTARLLDCGKADRPTGPAVGVQDTCSLLTAVLRILSDILSRVQLPAVAGTAVVSPMGFVYGSISTWVLRRTETG